ncbi:DUF6622 family protein [Gallaecimonas xiamenensis]|uniref:Transmembrane protein n=1 Tax=Gallaecimonas xiamenensis 3-C-1 TaxID=745411 RepID=K2J257_9GAMM|nr:DUF6622 family protein [Gallaecimonas xiamenensis]EKE77061.1 hypothetical protein B3C1_02610 [Gallaecimonas xiamenensis 3-C-1]
MLLEILRHTPLWVYGLLLGLLLLGLKQSRDRRLGLRQAYLLPLLMVALSLLGMASSFGWQGGMVLWWLAGLALAATLGRGLAGQVRGRYHRASGQFEVQGSWAPLLLILAIFFTKYGVGVMTALHPSLFQPGPVAGLCLLYGALSGLFCARALGLWRLKQAA